ncbi:hypothetical protein [Bifidobacterium simiarum]|uniref:hypothetical protein n=1 Tax=Bifidobacterium simiarum TaxID=2045441 RepID=UPI001BDC6804|nr:hypothetical protein [Bifidobacterium simiarum]MBT1165312.1 hypothetical protein [Bifidobacterium simiarum]
MCALVFLGASLVGSLLLRTQMVEDSFAITDVQQSIGRLTQDVQEDQTKLDALEASLPEKAQKLGMVPGSDALTIDLQGYKPSEGASASKSAAKTQASQSAKSTAKSTAKASATANATKNTTPNTKENQ